MLNRLRYKNCALAPLRANYSRKAAKAQFFKSISFGKSLTHLFTGLFFYNSQQLLNITDIITIILCDRYMPFFFNSIQQIQHFPNLPDLDPFSGRSWALTLLCKCSASVSIISGYCLRMVFILVSLSFDKIPLQTKNVAKGLLTSC